MQHSISKRFSGVSSVRSLILALAAGTIGAGLPIAALAQTAGGGDDNRAAMGGGLGDMLRLAQPLDVTEEMVAETVEVRERFGFNSDPEFVRELLTDPAQFNALVGRVTGGHYATPAEVQELAGRLRVETEAIDLMRRLRDNPDFAGLYVDRDGTLMVGTTGGEGVLPTAQLRELVGDPQAAERIRTFRAERSMDELQSLRDRVIEAIPELVEAGIVVSEVSLDVRGNQVRAGIANLDPEVRERLLQRFEGLELFEQEVLTPDNRFDTSDPIRAGVAITGCTSAWKAQDRTTNQLVLLTAGHCAAGATGTINGPGAVFNQGTNPNGTSRRVGAVDQNTWLFPAVLPGGARFGSGPVDALRMPLEVGSLPWLYAYDSANSGGFTNGEEAPVSEVDGTVVNGTTVCSAGRNNPGNQVGGTNWKNCGTVNAVNTSVTFNRSSGSPDQYNITNANRADYISTPGDSGAPIWRIDFDGSNFIAVAVGINTGGPTGAEVFSDIDRVENALNVNVLHF